MGAIGIASLLYFVSTVLISNKKVDINKYLTDNTVKILHSYSSALNKDTSFADIARIVLYEKVNSYDIQSLLDKKPNEIWLTCTPREDAKTICFDHWLTMQEMWDLRAKADPRSSTTDTKLIFELKKLEDTADTLCSLRAEKYHYALSTGEIINTVQSYDGVAYLCVNKDKQLVQFEMWST